MIDEIDESAREQIQRLLDHPTFANTYIAIRPDCHAGKGALIGYSAPHGAGRILSRTKAKQVLCADIFTIDMRKAGVFTTTATKETLDEAPGAYKDKNIIIQNIAQTVEINDFVKPVYSFKATGD